MNVAAVFFPKGRFGKRNIGEHKRTSPKAAEQKQGGTLRCRAPGWCWWTCWIGYRHTKNTRKWRTRTHEEWRMYVPYVSLLKYMILYMQRRPRIKPFSQLFRDSKPQWPLATWHARTLLHF